MNNCFIEGKLVYLRLPDIQKDVIDGHWHEWFNNDNITKYLYHGVYPISKEKQVKIVQDNLEKDDVILLSVINKLNDEICGIVSLKDIDLINRVAEITIVMESGKYPKNAPFEAWASLTQYGFEKLNLNKINAGHHIELWKWVNKIELLGYRLEGYIKNTHIKYGRINSTVRVGIQAEDYFNLTLKRDNKYLTNDMELLLEGRRRDNICKKFIKLIDGLYE